MGAPPLVRAGRVVIRYDAPDAGVPIGLAVFDVRGRRVRTLKDPGAGAGEHQVTWRGERNAGGRVLSGIYFLRLDTGSTRLAQKLPLIVH